MLKSSYTRERYVLGILAPSRAQEFLRELANLPGEFSPIPNELAYSRAMSAINRLRRKYPGAFGEVPYIGTLVLRDLVRKAWSAPDPRHAEWYLFRLRNLQYGAAHRMRTVQRASTASAKPEPEIPGGIPGTENEAKRFMEQSEPPPKTDIEAALVYLQKNLGRARFCPNEDCATPYFFLTKKGQKFCSPECATPARQESKRRWWQENRGNAAKGRGKTK